MKVLITGGAGFIGSHLAQKLSDRAEVIVLDNLHSGRRENLEGIDAKLIEGSIMDPEAVRPSAPRVPVAAFGRRATSTRGFDAGTPPG